MAVVDPRNETEKLVDELEIYQNFEPEAPPQPIKKIPA